MIDVTPDFLPQAISRDQGGTVSAILETSKPPGLSEPPDVLRLIRALRRRWRVASALGLVAAILAGLSAYAVVPRAKYTSRSTLHVATNPKYIIFDPKERLTDYRTYQRTQATMAKSLYVLGDALKRPEVAALRTVREQPDPAEWLAKSIKVDFPDASEVLEISLSGDSGGDLEVLVNSVVDSYLKLVVAEEQNERKARLVALKGLWKGYQDNLQAKRAAMRVISESIGSNDKQVLTMAHQSKIQGRDFAEQEHLKVSFELRKAEAELAVLEARAAEADQAIVSRDVIDERVGASPVVQALNERIRKLTRNYEDSDRVTRAKDDPALVAVRTQLDAARRELAARRRDLRPSIVAELRESARGEFREDLARLRAQVSVSRTYLEAIEKDLQRLQVESKTIGQGTMDLGQHQDELQIVSDTAHKIGAEVEAMEVELDAPPRIRIIDRATLPSKKDELRKVKASLAAAAGSLFLSMFLVAFWEFGARRINTVDQVVDGLRIKLVGSLPVVRQSSIRRDPAERDRVQGVLVESIDATRTMLLHAARLDGIRCVMIASASQGEAKTSLSTHLALSLARSGRRTLLVDADLRNPSAHKLFDLPPGPGLCEVLRGEAGLERVVRATPASGLDLLPAGRYSDGAIRVLTQEGGGELFDRLKGQYDFIIVDTAPVLLVADTLLLGHLVDAVLFSILRDVSRAPMVHAAHQRLSSLGVKILGAVVSGTPMGAHGYGYPYGKKDALKDPALAGGLDRA